jgi:uncharacterized protein YbcI
MADDGPSLDAVQTEIAREVEKVHNEAYGGLVGNFKVEISADLVVVVMDVEFARYEQTLIDAGRVDSVRQTREAFQEAIAPTFTAIVERATGRRVRSFASRMVMEPPWSVEVFRLDTPHSVGTGKEDDPDS